MLSDRQALEFWEQGAVVVEGVYAAVELKPLRAQLAQWVDESRAHAGPFGEMLDGRPRFDVEPGHNAAHPALRRVASPEEISASYYNLLQSQGPLVEAAADLLGQNLRFHHAKLNSKLPGSGTTVKWHQDFTFDPHSNDDCVTAMLYLDDIDRAIGPPRILPGSHRGPLYSLWQNGEFSGAVTAAVARDCEAGAIECLGSAGSLCLLHTRTLHASSANLTARPRTLYIATLTAADAVPLAPCAVPSRFGGAIVRGQDPGRIRSMAFTLENPEVPTGASFFDQQAG